MDNATKEEFQVYVATLERINDMLLTTLKEIVIIMDRMTPFMPDSHSWQDMLKVLDKTIEESEKVRVISGLH